MDEEIKCNKASFETQQLASIRLNEIKKEHKSKVPNTCPTRIYKCDKCKQWHLTKMNKSFHDKVQTREGRHEIAAKRRLRKDVEYWCKKLGVESEYG